MPRHVWHEAIERGKGAGAEMVGSLGPMSLDPRTDRTYVVEAEFPDRISQESDLSRVGFDERQLEVRPPDRQDEPWQPAAAAEIDPMA